MQGPTMYSATAERGALSSARSSRSRTTANPMSTMRSMAAICLPRRREIIMERIIRKGLAPREIFDMGLPEDGEKTGRLEPPRRYG